MKEVRLLMRWLSVMLVLLLSMCFSSAWAQFENKHEINGQISIRIERKSMSAQEAQNHINRKDSIPLMVSLIFKGEWVTLFDQDFWAYANQSSFSYCIATAAGDNISVSAPMYTSNMPAYMLAARSMNCSAPDGSALLVPRSEAVTYIVGPLWNTLGCPQYDYGCGFSSSSNMQPRKETIDGEECYVVDLFRVYFKLKRLETVYVRGVDDLGTYKSDNSGFQATSGTTELNIMNSDTKRATYWPGGSQGTDWTQAPKQYYGGIIPGGIFIEQAPEVGQFEPCD